VIIAVKILQANSALLHCNMATASLTMLNFEASTPVENEVNIDLDFYHTLFIYMRLLKFDNKTMSEKHKIKFDKDLFKVPNQKAFHLVVHFLFNKLDGPRSQDIFRDVWPIIEKKQEAEFRKKVRLWLVEVQEVRFYLKTIGLSILTLDFCRLTKMPSSLMDTSILQCSCLQGERSLPS